METVNEAKGAFVDWKKAYEIEHAIVTNVTKALVESHDWHSRHVGVDCAVCLLRIKLGCALQQSAAEESTGGKDGK